MFRRACVIRFTRKWILAEIDPNLIQFLLRGNTGNFQGLTINARGQKLTLAHNYNPKILARRLTRVVRKYLPFVIRSIRQNIANQKKAIFLPSSY